MKTIKVFLLIIFVALSSFLVSCERNGVKVVNEIPTGFIELSSEGSDPKNSLNYKF